MTFAQFLCTVIIGLAIAKLQREYQWGTFKTLTLLGIPLGLAAALANYYANHH